jgi:hypothetical protein
LVQAIVSLSGNANRTINVVKALYGLRDKSEALEKIVRAYEKEMLELEFKPRIHGANKEKRERT